MPELTLEQCKAACAEAIKALDDNKAEIEQVKGETAGNLMLFMQKMVPLVVSKLGDKIQAYGFTADQPGIMQFIAATNPHSADPEVAAAKQQIQGAIMPQMAPPK
eukprot:m.429710 g.429710  ORF g.429710 m.429710 type:complete len:105 (+) comp17052_c0_seq1:89-403(+)